MWWVWGCPATGALPWGWWDLSVLMEPFRAPQTSEMPQHPPASHDTEEPAKLLWAGAGRGSTLRPGAASSWGILNKFLGCKSSQEQPFSALGRITRVVLQGSC